MSDRVAVAVALPSLGKSCSFRVLQLCTIEALRQHVDRRTFSAVDDVAVDAQRDRCVRVTEEARGGSDVDAARDEVRGPGVPQDVEASRRDSGALRKASVSIRRGFRAEALADLVGEYGVRGVRQVDGAGAQPVLSLQHPLLSERVDGARRQRKGPNAAALSGL